MKSFRIVYRWSGREYSTTMPGRNAAQAITAADVQIMPGAKIIGVEAAQ